MVRLLGIGGSIGRMRYRAGETILANEVEVFDFGIVAFGRGREVVVLFVEAKVASMLASDCVERLRM